MRYQSKPYRSLSFLQRENLNRDPRDRQNKENNNLINLPNRPLKHKEHKEHDLLHKPKLQHVPSQSTQGSLCEPPEALKKVYSEQIGKDYSLDILEHLCLSAQSQRGMLGVHAISASLRSKMVDWMIEVLSSYKMSEQTFFRSVYLMDAYMKNCGVRLQVKDLHLIGVSAMFSAAKYEEIHPLKLGVIYEKIARKKFKKSQILDKESDIVKALDFKLEAPSVYDISRHLIEQAKFSLSEPSKRYFDKIVLYLAKMALFSHELAEESPRLLACGVVFIALKTLEQVDSSAQPQARLSQIGGLVGCEEQVVLQVSRRVLELAKNFSKLYPSLGNLKKFNKFEYGTD